MKYVGIDWAHGEHVVCVLDQDGQIVDERKVVHRARSLAAMMEWLEDIAPLRGGRTVGLEAGALLLVEYLLDRGESVYVLNPKVVDRYRDRHSPAGAKDDRRDALVIADMLRVEHDRFRPFEPDTDLTSEMRLRVRLRERLLAKRTAATNELGDALRQYYPAAASLPSHWRDPWFLEFLGRYPDPDAASRAKRAGLAAVLQKHRVRKWTPDTLKQHLRDERMPARAPITRAYRALVCDLVEQVQMLNTQIRQADDEIARLLNQHPDRDILLSLPGVRTTLAARMLAEIGDDRERLLDHTTLQVRAGTAPVTRQSGRGRRSVSMRRACNQHLHNAFFLHASTSRARSAWAKAYYDSQREAGRSHAAASRGLSNKWAKIVATLLARGVAYDESHHLDQLDDHAVPWWIHRAA